MHTVRELQEAAARHFKVDVYRVSLRCSGSLLENGDMSLEECGVTEERTVISVFISGEEPLMLAPFTAFLACLVQHAVVDSSEASLLHRRVMKDPAEDASCRISYLARLKAVQEKRKSLQDEKELAEAEFSQVAKERDHLDAQEQQQRLRLGELMCSTSWPQRLVPFATLPLMELVKLAVEAGIICGAHVAPAISGDGGMDFRAALAEHVACHQCIARWVAEVEHFHDSVSAIEQNPVWDFDFSEPSQHGNNIHLERFMPDLMVAEEALSSITKQDFAVIRAFTSPPPVIMQIVEAVCTLLGASLNGDSAIARWQSAKTSVLKDPHLIERMLNFKKDDVADHIVRKLENFISSDDWDPDKISSTSKVVKGFSIWVRAICAYHPVAHLVRQNRRMVKWHKERLQVHSRALENARARLSEAEERLQSLQHDQASLCCLQGLLAEPKCWSARSMQSTAEGTNGSSSPQASQALSQLCELVALLGQTSTCKPRTSRSYFRPAPSNSSGESGGGMARAVAFFRG
jgi:hypothetical protein